MQGVRELCDQYGILLIADEVMAGFGRTGRWFAVDHWDVVPDLITMAKGLTSSYLPLGGVAIRRHIADTFNSTMFFGGLTYNSHPVRSPPPWQPWASTRRIAWSNVPPDGRRCARTTALAARHPSVGTHQPRALRHHRPGPAP